VNLSDILLSLIGFVLWVSYVLVTMQSSRFQNYYWLHHVYATMHWALVLNKDFVLFSEIWILWTWWIERQFLHMGHMGVCCCVCRTNSVHHTRVQLSSSRLQITHSKTSILNTRSSSLRQTVIHTVWDDLTIPVVDYNHNVCYLARVARHEVGCIRPGNSSLRL